jgi:hypothetical protein
MKTKAILTKSLAVILPMIVLIVLASSCDSSDNSGKHLFILSGQSNMQGLRPQESFTPTVEAEFGAENVIVAMDALGGQPIRRWYKDWAPIEVDTTIPRRDRPRGTGDLYDRLLVQVYDTISDLDISTVTFVWMQGERDAREELSEVYEESLIGLYDQLCEDLDRSDINFVIGRLSDFDMNNERYPHWTMIRDIQVKVAESNPRFEWVNTDDLNDGVNRRGREIKDDLHMSADGYVSLGKRFAESSIELIHAHSVE